MINDLEMFETQLSRMGCFSLLSSVRASSVQSGDIAGSIIRGGHKKRRSTVIQDSNLVQYDTAAMKSALVS